MRCRILLTSPGTGRWFVEQKKGRLGRVKIGLLLLGVSLTLSAFSQAGTVRGGVSGRSFHTGFVAQGVNRMVVRGGGFNRDRFRGRFIARRNRPIVFQQYAWPGYWYPYGDLNYSYLEPDSASDYQYWDNSSAYGRQSPAQFQPQPTNRGVSQSPVIVVINTGNSRPTDSAAPADPRGNGEYANNGYIPANAAGQQRFVMQDPNEHNAPDPVTPGDPVVPQPTPVPAQNTKTSVQTGTGPFSKFVVVSYLQDRGKDVISVKNIETNDVQRITAQPNIDHLRLVEVHPNPDLRQFEAIISNGSDQGPVRFQF
jgi:hypothetical protein